MQIFASKKRLPLGRIITYFSLAMLAISLILLLTGGSRAANNNIEVTLHTDETKDYERTPEEGYSSLEKQEPAEIVAEQSCNYANVHCAQGEMGLTAKVNSLLTALVAFNKQGAEQGDGSPKKSYVYNNEKTLFGFVTKAIKSTYTPPASGAYYVADAIDHMGISRTAYAQGFGYYGLQPFLVTWKVMRNFVYVAFSIVIIGVAISVLMRQSFSSNNAVTVQQILPNIIITLIAITFSYAIAGFLIDLMYWIMYAVGSFIQVNTGHTTSGDGGAWVDAGDGGVDYILSQSIWGVFTSAMSAGFTNTYSGVSNMIQGLFNSDFWGGIVGAISGGLAAFVMVMIVLVNVFKLFFILAKSYVFVVLYTVFSPFILAMQVFKPGTFRRWVLSIAANLSPFALTFFMLVFLGICNAVFQKSSANGWVPPFMFGGKTDSYAVGSVVVIGMILAMNEIITEIKKKIGGEGGFFEKMGSAAMANAEKGGLTKAAAAPFTMPFRAAKTAGKAGLEYGKDYLRAQAGAHFAYKDAYKWAGDTNTSEKERGDIADEAKKTYLKEQAAIRNTRFIGNAYSIISPELKEVYQPEERAKHKAMKSIADTNENQLKDSTDPAELKLLGATRRWNNRYKNFQDWQNGGSIPIQTFISLTE